MLGNKVGRPAVRENDRISCTIKQHIARTSEIVKEEGLSQAEASKKAYQEIMEGGHKVAIDTMISEMVSKRNKR